MLVKPVEVAAWEAVTSLVKDRNAAKMLLPWEENEFTMKMPTF